MSAGKRRHRTLKELSTSPTARRLRQPAMLYLLKRSTRPLSLNYGHDRGSPVDRFYIEQFLTEHRALVRGHCLEIKDTRYIDQFGNGDVVNAEVLDIDRKNPSATVFGDLQDLAGVPSNRFDCLLITQTLMFIRDPAAAVGEMFRILAPGGSALVTLSTMARVDHGLLESDAWRFMPAGARYLFGDRFGIDNVVVRAYRNALTGMAYWVGMAEQDLPKRAFAENDPDFPVTVTVKATKSLAADGKHPSQR
jgi:SAM-dependent methyltransferase